jgi:hypothetical protein
MRKRRKLKIHSVLMKKRILMNQRRSNQRSLRRLIRMSKRSRIKKITRTTKIMNTSYRILKTTLNLEPMLTCIKTMM